MALDDSMRQLALGVVAGFDDAAGLYRRMSGGWDLHMAPEYYCTVKVAEKLAEPEGRYVTLEQNIADALNWSGRRDGCGEDRGTAGSRPLRYCRVGLGVDGHRRDSGDQGGEVHHLRQRQAGHPARVEYVEADKDPVGDGCVVRLAVGRGREVPRIEVRRRTVGNSKPG